MRSLVPGASHQKRQIMLKLDLDLHFPTDATIQAQTGIQV